MCFFLTCDSSITKNEENRRNKCYEKGNVVKKFKNIL